MQAVLAQRPSENEPPTARQRRELDRGFARILALIAPRIRHFIRQYGLTAHWEDAEQVCAIAVHRALQTYDPTKAQFTTFINWMIRGELQGLRFRLMTDQRPSARKVSATTVSLHALVGNGEDETEMEVAIEEESALPLTEASASNYLAGSAIGALLDGYVAHLRAVGLQQLSRRTRARRDRVFTADDRPRLKINALDPTEVSDLEQRIARNRALVEHRLFDLPAAGDLLDDPSITKERVRQITKRAVQTMAELVAKDPRFAVMREVAGAGRLDGATGAPSAPAPGRPPRANPIAPDRGERKPVPSDQHDPGHVLH
ncbi:sigma factor [Sphingomonas folli]|uniref:sigma factor n=1 Tax=Sphingomonas folli TaxID=2862497 RepID=UPI0027E5006E|nr:sigma factor [Sphingomonas folli]